MSKKIMITGATDGIGLETAKKLILENHHLIVHGRSKEKLEKVIAQLVALNPDAMVDGFIADFSNLNEVKMLGEALLDSYNTLDVLINNAGIFVTSSPKTEDSLELRFAVNTVAPYLLSKAVLPLMKKSGRIVNLSSAAQGKVDLQALESFKAMSDNDAYAQSKLALTMWSMELGLTSQASNGPSYIAVNPKSFLSSKMVKQAYGTEGHDLGIGADILYRAALSDAFGKASGKYFDNDMGQFSNPHPDALIKEKRIQIIDVIEKIISK